MSVRTQTRFAKRILAPLNVRAAAGLETGKGRILCSAETTQSTPTAEWINMVYPKKQYSAMKRDVGLVTRYHMSEPGKQAKWKKSDTKMFPRAILL